MNRLYLSTFIYTAHAQCIYTLYNITEYMWVEHYITCCNITCYRLFKIYMDMQYILLTHTQTHTHIQKCIFYVCVSWWTKDSQQSNIPFFLWDKALQVLSKKRKRMIITLWLYPLIPFQLGRWKKMDLGNDCWPTICASAGAPDALVSTKVIRDSLSTYFLIVHVMRISFHPHIKEAQFVVFAATQFECIL